MKAQQLGSASISCLAQLHVPKASLRTPRAQIALVLTLALCIIGAKKLGMETGSEPFFDTVRITTGSSKDLVQRALDQGVNLRALDDETVTVSFDEVTTIADVDQLLAILNGGSAPDFSANSLAGEVRLLCLGPALVC